MPADIHMTRVRPDETARTFGTNVYRDAYAHDMTVSQYLERMDPTSEYPADERGLDAFERVMRAAGLVAAPISGMGVRASTYAEATDTPEKRALMHEFAARIWRQTTNPSLNPPTPLTRSLLQSGDYAVNTILRPFTDDLTPRYKRLEPPIPLASLVAATTSITGNDYRSLYVVDDLGTDAYRQKRVAEGADIPTTTMVTGEHSLRIHKYGRALRATYEQLRRQRLDRIAFLIMRMAVQAEVDKVSTVIDTIVNGDGNSNTSAVVIDLTDLDAGAGAGTLTLEGWLTFKLRANTAYSTDIVLGQEDSIKQLLLLPVLSNTNQMPVAMMEGGPFGTIRPINNRMADGQMYGVTADAPSLKLVTFDSRAAIERVQEIGGQISEVDRFIQNQTEMLTMTEVEGFGILDPNASRILNINA